MHLYKTIKSFLYDQDYFVDMWSNNVHIYGFLDILCLKEDKASFRFSDFTLEIIGQDFRVLKLSKMEILIQGGFLEMRKTWN